MAKSVTLEICHLYPDLMDTYGDMGNIITLVKRCQWRGIGVNVTNVSIGDSLSLAPRSSAKQSEVGDFDFFFFGGGQDRQQVIVAKDLRNKASYLKEAVNQESTLLAICGGYQLLQNFFKTIDGTVIEGIGLFDAHTVGSTTRMTQNLLVKLNPQLTAQIKDIYQTTHYPLSTAYLIGFENHSGKTYLGKSIQALGKVIKGSGNNGEDRTEGAVYKNAFGCYLHGSLLPKNPHFADYLISKALERKYGKIKLKPLDDSIEWQAHQMAVERTRSMS